MSRSASTIATLRTRGLLLFALLAFGVRLLVPFGFMPHADEGGYRITLCTGEGMVSAWVDADGKLHPGKKDPSQRGDQKCAFSALAGAPAMPEQPATEPVAVEPEAIAFAEQRQVAVGRGLAAPPPPSTGPPSIA
jgi:hypothetical protein